MYANGPGVTPNSGKDQEWRQESGYSYSGILAETGVAGQPFMMRMQGIPTAPGYRDRIPKWNAILPPIVFLLILEALRRLEV